MNKNYSIGEINFHLLKRKTKKQGNVYYLAILGEEIGKNGHRTYKSMRSTGVGNVGLARKIVSVQLEYRTDVWDSGNFSSMKHSSSWEGRAPAGCRT